MQTGWLEICHSDLFFKAKLKKPFFFTIDMQWILEYFFPRKIYLSAFCCKFHNFSMKYHFSIRSWNTCKKNLHLKKTLKIFLKVEIDNLLSQNLNQWKLMRILNILSRKKVTNNNKSIFQIFFQLILNSYSQAGIKLECQLGIYHSWQDPWERKLDSKW